MTDYANLPSGGEIDVAASVGDVLAGPITPDNPRHLVWPLQMVSGPGGSRVLATYVQDSLEEVTQSVALVLSTVIGERYRDAPDYGVTQLVTSDPVTLAEAATAVAQWEPRATVTFTPGPVANDGSQAVTVNVSLLEGGSDIVGDLDR